MFLLRTLKDLSLETLSVPSYTRHLVRSPACASDEQDEDTTASCVSTGSSIISINSSKGSASWSGSCRVEVIGPVDFLPYEVLLHLFGLLRFSLSDTCTLALVCKRWHTIVCKENWMWEEAIVMTMQATKSGWDDVVPYRQQAGGLRSLLIRKAKERRELRDRIERLRKLHDEHVQSNLRCNLELAPHRPRLRPSMRVVVQGDRYVGKTATLSAARSLNALPTPGVLTEDDLLRTSVTVFGVSIDVEVHELNVRTCLTNTSRDVAHHSSLIKKHERQRPSIYQNADAVLLLFNLIDRSTFTSLREKHIPALRNLCGSAVPIVLGGNFLDLLTCEPPSILVHDDNIVTLAEVKKLALEMNAMSYVPYCALVGHEVRVLLEECAVAVALGPSSASSPGSKNEYESDDEESGEYVKEGKEKEKTHCLLS